MLVPREKRIPVPGTTSVDTDKDTAARVRGDTVAL